MNISNFRARGLIAAAAVLTSLIAAAPANAGVIATFDPAFNGALNGGGGNPALDNVGFRGFVDLTIGSGCSTSSGYQYTNASDQIYSYYYNSACSIMATSGEIHFYNSTTNPAGSPNPIIPGPYTTIDLTPYLQSDFVTGGAFDEDGNLIGIDTKYSVPFLVSISDGNLAFPINYSGFMQLYFLSDNIPEEPGCDGECTARIRQVDPAYLIACPNTTPGTVPSCTVPAQGPPGTTTSQPAAVTFTNVPEPGTIPLALLGLVALVGTRRRLRAASAGRESQG